MHMDIKNELILLSRQYDKWNMGIKLNLIENWYGI